jgi:hypothetical protein
MKKNIFSFLGIFGILGLLCFFFIVRNYNNFRLNGFAKQLYDMELPEDIIVVEKDKICGKLNGNGNSMDFLACLLVKTKRSKEELEILLKSVNFRCIGDREGICVDKEVVKVDGEILQSNYLQHEIVNFESLSKETNFSNYYAFVIYDGGYSSDFDIRGH